MKKIFSLLIVALLTFTHETSKSQNTFPSSGAAGIGTATPNSSSLLDVTSTTKGVLVPRMTKTQRDAIVSPATGLLIYQTNSTAGFYYYSGSAWTAVSAGANKGLSNLNATSINQSLLPNATGTFDLGSSSLKWRDAYLGSIHFADGTSMTTASGGGGGIGGSGTANYLPRFTASTTLGNSLFQDDGSKVYIAPNTLWAYAKLTVDQSSNDNTLNLVNEKSGTGTTMGIYNVLYGTGGATGLKTGIRNEVSASSSATGSVTGTDNSLANGGSGASYATNNYVSHSGTGSAYGTYTNISNTNNNSQTFGQYQTISTGAGNNYGLYTTLSGTGTTWGHYITISNTSASTKYGLYVNLPSTTGLDYGIYSTVSTSNASSYAASLNGKVYMSGNVGIGTGSPAAKLHIVDAGGSGATANANADFVVEDNTKAYINILTPDANESGLLFGTPTSSADGGIVFNATAVNKGLEFRTGGNSTKMSITSAGDVCINTTTPATGYKLSVYGNIICEELKVQLHANWPDYVFDENYSLPSISDLKNFVSANKHLPGIPSSVEVKEQGISVGDMQTKMMQKIEELSLYIIQLQNEIDELKTSKN